MPKKSAAKKTAKEIVHEKLPDMKIDESAADAKDAESSHVKARPGASMAELRRKYAAPDAADAEAPLAPPDDQGIEVRQVRPKRSHADPVDDLGPRSLIISEDDDEILGSQG